MVVKGKVQKNKKGVNVLVEISGGDTRSFYSLNKKVVVNNVLSNEEIIKLWKLRKIDDELKLARAWLIRQDGYALSVCEGDNISYSSVVQYTEK
jgi:ribosomal protein S4E